MIYYEITVGSHLMPNRLKDFEGLCASLLPDGKTVLSGVLNDQATLFSVLSRIRDMNLPLISVQKQPDMKEEKP